QRKQPPADSMSLLAAEVREALQLFGIYDRCDFTAIKVRYKELAKRYHPDAAGAAKGTEEKLKSINAAYAVLKKYSHLFGVMPV
ncbi:MAG: DnaJ domain-containing protein, partial [Thalassospira sp.]|nr:DnaJ domain-containing protein [Thalassospira sp.]